MNISTTNNPYEIIFEAIAESVLVHTMNKEGDNSILYANKNACNLLGYTKDDILNITVEKLSSHKTNQLRYIAESNEIYKNYQPLPFESALKCKDGDIKLVEVEPSITTLDDKPVIVAIIREITDRVLQEEQLKDAIKIAEESDRLKTAFLANMSHEIRTPMNGIIGFSNMLEKPKLSEEKRTYYARIIIESSKQLLNIVNDILDLSKIQTGQVELKNANLSLNDLITDIYSLYLPKVKEKGINLLSYKALHDDESMVMIDRIKIHQILNNLMSNALKFTHKGNIKVGYKIENSEIIFFVEDTGIGIKKELHTKIFERFRQAELDMNRQYGGTGLGLAITRSLVKLMEGKIWLESEAGVGTKFYVSIPLVKYDPSAPKEISHIVIDEPNVIKQPLKSQKYYTKNQKFLVAEDEDNNYLFIEELLRFYNCDIVRAYTGQEAVDIYKKEKSFCIVFMDIKMPSKNGFEALAEIKKINPDQVVVAQTAYAMPDDRKRMIEAGFDDYLSKPILKEKLNIVIDKYLKKRSDSLLLD